MADADCLDNKIQIMYGDEPARPIQGNVTGAIGIMAAVKESKLSEIVVLI